MTTLPIAGIDQAICQDIIFKLRLSESNLSHITSHTILLLQTSIDIVNNEMLRILNEIKYWRKLSESTFIEKFMTHLFHQGPITFLKIIRSYLFDINIDSKESTIDMNNTNNANNIQLRLLILHNKFHSLALILNQLYHCGSNIRKILNIYEQLWCENYTLNESIITDINTPKVTRTKTSGGVALDDNNIILVDELTTEQYTKFTQKSQKIIESCLETIINIFGNDTFVHRTTDETTAVTLQLSLYEIYELAEKCVAEAQVSIT